MRGKVAKAMRRAVRQTNLNAETTYYMHPLRHNIMMDVCQRKMVKTMKQFRRAANAI